MASLGWFRDLLMLAFSLLLVVITGLLAPVPVSPAPLGGDRSLLPMSLIIIATVCMTWTLRHWTTMSFRRAVLSLVISLSVTWVIARGCIEGVARRDGVFLRTSKTGGRRTILTALKLTRWETVLAVALYICVGLLADLRHQPWLLIFLVFVQATVYLCAPIAAVWNIRAQGARSQARQRGYAERRLRATRRRRARGLVPRPAAAALTALCIGGVASAFVAPAALLHATAAARVSPQSLLGSASTQVYLKVGSSSTAAGSAYYPISSMHLADVAARSARGAEQFALSFQTSSLVLLGRSSPRPRTACTSRRSASRSGSRVRAAASRRPSWWIPSPPPQSRPCPSSSPVRPRAASRSCFPRPAGDHSPGTLQHIGPFAALPRRRRPRRGDPGGHRRRTPSYPVTGVSLSQAASGAPINLSFASAALPLLDRIFHAQGAGAAIPVLTLSVRAGANGGQLRHTFSQLSISSFAENLSGSVSGAVTLVALSR